MGKFEAVKGKYFYLVTHIKVALLNIHLVWTLNYFMTLTF